MNIIQEDLTKAYRVLFGKYGTPENMFNLRPAIPFVGDGFQKTKPRVLSYASAENLSYAYNDELNPNTSKIHELGDTDQFNRARYFHERTKESFPQVHIEPFNNGSQLFITRHILSKLGYKNKFLNTPHDFIEQIAVANPGKFSIKSTKNRDYAGDRKKMAHSLEYIKKDIFYLRPDIVILPKSIFNTINKMEKWSAILKMADIEAIDFIQTYQLSFFNNFRTKTAVSGLPKPREENYPYGNWLQEINCGKLDITAYFSWVENELYQTSNIKKC